MRHAITAAAAVTSLAWPAVVRANNEAFELWLNPSTSVALDNDTSLKIETAQRLRNSADGRSDTYFGRLWINQDLANTVTVSGALKRRINDAGPDETRLIQQLTSRHGVFRTRLRLEQRFVDDADRTGLRVRPRLGIALPLDERGRWSAKADTELFLTLRSNNVGGQKGLTGLRTQIGLGYEISGRLSLSLGYLGQQDFDNGGPDVVGHAPIIGFEHAF